MNYVNRKIIISLVFILIVSSAFAVKPFRIGVRAGLPNIASINAEFVLPIMNYRIAPTLDFSDFSLTIDNVKVDFTYLEAGVNFYLAPNAKWLYGNLSYINMKTNLKYSDRISEGSIVGIGTATADISIKSFSLKLGAKLGGMLYIRPEVGFLFSPMADTIDIDVYFPGVTIPEAQTEEVPSALTGAFIFNIGFGFAF